LWGSPNSVHLPIHYTHPLLRLYWLVAIAVGSSNASLLFGSWDSLGWSFGFGFPLCCNVTSIVACGSHLFRPDIIITIDLFQSMLSGRSPAHAFLAFCLLWFCRLCRVHSSIDSHLFRFRHSCNRSSLQFFVADHIWCWHLISLLLRVRGTLRLCCFAIDACCCSYRCLQQSTCFSLSRLRSFCLMRSAHPTPFVIVTSSLSR
jgi:hypothetical protein